METNTSFSLDWTNSEPKLEAQFLKTHYRELLTMGPVVLTEFAALSLADLGFELYEFLRIFESGISFVWTLCFFVGSNLLLLTVFHLAKK